MGTFCDWDDHFQNFYVVYKFPFTGEAQANTEQLLTSFFKKKSQ